MKKHIKILSQSGVPAQNGPLSNGRPFTALLADAFFFLVLFQPLFSHAANGGDEEVTKRKLINKSYNVRADDKLEIDNQFGNVTVSTWDKSEITVDIEIVTNASTEEKATALMDNIDVKDARDGNTISFKTKVGDLKNGEHGYNNHKEKNGKKSFNIEYIIHMPAANALRIKNSFGKIALPDFRGQVDLTSKFGSLTAGKLSNVDAIDVQFGEASLAGISNGRLTLKFDKRSDIGNLSGSVKVNIEFSDHVQCIVDDNINDLNISESYSNVRMVVTKGLSADFQIHTSFGEFHNESDFTLQERKNDSDAGPRFDKDFSGRAGDGKAKIRIRSSFGSVRLSYNGTAI